MNKSNEHNDNHESHIVEDGGNRQEAIITSARNVSDSNSFLVHLITHFYSSSASKVYYYYLIVDRRYNLWRDVQHFLAINFHSILIPHLKINGRFPELNENFYLYRTQVLNLL